MDKRSANTRWDGDVQIPCESVWQNILTKPVERLRVCGMLLSMTERSAIFMNFLLAWESH